MTETPIDLPEGQVPVDQADEQVLVDKTDEQSSAPELQHCRWCGQPHDTMANESEDWLCTECERYQDTTTCPTCKQLARVSELPADLVPEPHAPARRRKAKE